MTSPPFDLHGAVLLGLVGYAVALGTTAPRDATPQDDAGRPPLDARGSITARIEEADTLRTGFACGALFGLGANLVALRFVPEVITRFTPLPLSLAVLALVLLAAAQAVPWAVGGLVTQLLARRRFALPAWLAYAIGVYVATFLPAVFPWTPAGGLTPWPALVQIAELVGERGASFTVALAAGLAASAFRRVRAERAAMAGLVPGSLSLAVLVLLLAYGHVRMRGVEQLRETAPHARITLVQPGFEASDRWEETRAGMMLDRLTVLTKSAEARGSDLTVWPESAYPFTLLHSARHSPPRGRAVLQPGIAGPVITGAYMAGAEGLGYNSAFLATSDGRLSKPYDKRHLLWFGETVPLSETFPWLRRVFAKGTGLAPGQESVVFVTGAIRAAVLNCYEDTLPEAGREAMEAGPNLLINLTNDAWFVRSAEGELHLRLAVLRAIETRRDLVRAVNQGPTSFVDATGRVRSRYDLPIPGTLSTIPALLEGPPTLFVRFGDAPLVLLVLGAVAGAWWRSKR